MVLSGRGAAGAADDGMSGDLKLCPDAAANNSASRMLEWDVDNLANHFGQFAPELQATQYGKGIWERYLRGELLPCAFVWLLPAKRKTGRRAFRHA